MTGIDHELETLAQQGDLASFCPHCHAAPLLGGIKDIGDEGFLEYLESDKDWVNGVTICGGEPTLQPDLVPFIKAVRGRGLAVKLDTNGSNPDLLGRLMDEGLLDYAAMDVKNTLAKYPETAGLPGLDLDAVVQSAELLMRERIPFEFRTTLVREFHTREDVLEIGRWLRGAPRYFLQAFVDSGDLLGGGLHPVDEDEMRAMASLLKPFFREVAVRGV